MLPASRVGSDTVGGGVILGAGNLLVKIDALFWTVVGDAVFDHGTGSHNAATMIQGSTLVSINGVPASLLGHAASCGHTTTGTGLVSGDA